MDNSGGSESLVQYELFPLKEVVVNEIPMGVLSDGTPYLTLYGLAKICGIDDTPLRVFTTNWPGEKHKPRGAFVNGILESRGYRLDSLFTRVINSAGVETHAYPDYVCMAILEYYAFEAQSPFDPTIARNNFRSLAVYTLRRMIYEQVGIDPTRQIAESWQVYQQRIIMEWSLLP